jgi:LPXTG-motif cell wall-anchored protein
MKTKTMVAHGTQGMFVLFIAIAILAAYALPALALPGSAIPSPGDDQVVAGTNGPQSQVLERVEIVDSALLSIGEQAQVPDAGADEAVEPAAPDAGADEAVAPDEPEEASVPDAGSDEAAEPSADTSRVPQAEETTPSEEPDDDDTPTLPYTGGNGTPYLIGGLLIALAGVALFIGKRHVYNR